MQVVNTFLSSDVFCWNEVARKSSADFHVHFFELFSGVLANGRDIRGVRNRPARVTAPRFIIAVRKDECTAALEHCAGAGFEEEASSDWRSLPPDQVQTRAISALLDVAAGLG
jgi:hypothetical protein